MANLPLAFGEVLAGGVLLTAGISGASIADVFAGNIHLSSPSSSGGGPAVAGAGGSSANPFARAKGFKLGRTDMGVDATMEAGSPILAPFASQLVNIEQNWFNGQPALFFKVTSGPYAGKFYYLAEQITGNFKVGDKFNAGDQIATYASQGTGIEMGLAKNATQTLAQGTSGYHEGQVTKAGQMWREILQQLGVA